MRSRERDHAPAPVSITGVPIQSKRALSASGTVTNGNTVVVRVTLGNNSTKPNATLTIGGASGNRQRHFLVTKRKAAVDTTRDPFTFTDQNRRALNTWQFECDHGERINAPAPVSITGGAYSVNGGAFTAITGTVTNGNTVGGAVTPRQLFDEDQCDTDHRTVSGTFSAHDEGSGGQTPKPFTFTDQTDVALNTVVSSNAITVSGINAPRRFRSRVVPIRSTAALSQRIGNGDQWQHGGVRVNLVGQLFDETSATLTIGNRQRHFRSRRSRWWTRHPDPFTFTTRPRGAHTGGEFECDQV